VRSSLKTGNMSMSRLSMAGIVAPPTTLTRRARPDAQMAFRQSRSRRCEDFPRRFLRVSKNDAKYVLAQPGRAPITRALFVGTGVIQALVWPVSVDCSAPSSAIVRDTRSRSRTAAITPHTTATTNAIHEKRVSQRSAATPA
jgi:hypothetical protein